MSYVWSALFFHSHGRVWRGGVLGVLVVIGVGAGIVLGLGFPETMIMTITAAAVMVGGTWGGIIAASCRDFMVLYVLPAPRWWVARRLRALGYAGPVARRNWEMHVNECRHWRRPDEEPADTVRRFRAAYTADRLRWLVERPPDVGLIICTYNRLPSAEWAALRRAGAWTIRGPLHPAIPAVAHDARQRAVQHRMFGARVSAHDRTQADEWVTVYVPPRSMIVGMQDQEEERGSTTPV